MSNDHKKRGGIFAKLRAYFLTGLVIAAPIAITITVILWLIEIIDDWVLPLVPKAYLPDAYLEYSVPGMGVLVAVICLVILGFLTANFVGKSIVNIGTSWLEKMPIVRTVYKALKQIFETVANQGQTSFKQVALIEYPRKGLYAIAFVATETQGEVGEKIEEETLSVFLPTTPNPTSGFLLFVPKKDVKILDMDVEDGAKLVISAGLVNPDTLPIKEEE